MRGEAWEEVILETFARLQLQCSQKFIPLLESLQKHSDMDILVLSPYDSEGIQQAIEKLRECGNQVTFYKTEGGSL